MKRALILCSVAVMCFFSSCKDECEGVTCLNDGVCVDGTCNCPTGYSGVNCEIEPDPCEDVTCVNGTATAVGSTCDCVCEDGYEGTNCDELSKTKFIGTYNGNETCSASTDVYSVTVTSATAADEFNISNIYDAGFSVVAVVTDSDSFNIPSQAFGTGNITGSGSLTSSNTITITYTITVGGSSDSCTYTATK